MKQLYKDLRGEWNEFVALPGPVEKFLIVAGVIALAIIAARLVTNSLTGIYWRRIGLGRAVDITRSPRQQTVISLIRSIVRYTIYGIAIFIVIGVVTGKTPTVVLGASILIGLALQQLLTDVIAGLFLLFEGQFEVGDYIVIDDRVRGVVEEFNVRTTVLRAPNGDRITILNGRIGSFTKISGGVRRLGVELTTSNREKLRDAVEQMPASLPAVAARVMDGPELEGVDELEPGRYRARLSVRVAPTFEWLVEDCVPAAFERLLGESLLGQVRTFDADEQGIAKVAAPLVRPAHV